MPTSVMPSRSIVGIAAASSPRAAASTVRVSFVASASVCERVAREKSSKRSRSTTVRPTRPRRAQAARDAVDEADQRRVDELGRPRPASDRAL